MKWFTIEGLKKEAKRVRWPKINDLTKNTVTVLTFTVTFGIFFVLCDLFGTAFLKMIGIG